MSSVVVASQKSNDSFVSNVSSSSSALGGTSKSKCRAATLQTGRPAQTLAGIRRQILLSRGSFEGLPIGASNDLVTGSWWFVWASLLSALIPLVPLVDIYTPFFVTPDETELKAFSQSVTWFLLAISGVFFTLGSYAFVRAFETPSKPPLLPNYKHFCTDELLGAWFYLFAVLPAIPYSMVYIRFRPDRLVYWGTLVCAVVFSIGSAGFVYTSYPSHHHEGGEQHGHLILPCIECVFGKKSWVCYHLQNDWLVACWFCFWSTALMTFGSWFLLICAENDRQVFVFLTGFVDSFLFLMGSAYFCAGSYPPPDHLIDIDHDDEDIINELQQHEGFQPVLSPLFEEEGGEAEGGEETEKKVQKVHEEHETSEED